MAQDTQSLRTPLEKALKRFESSWGLPHTSSPTAARRHLEEVIERAARERAKHPGLHFLSELQLHIICLKQFLDGAETCLANLEGLNQMAFLVDACYRVADDGTLRNQVLRVEGEDEAPNFSSADSYKTRAEKWRPDAPAWIEDWRMQAIEEDLKQHLPTVSMETIRALQTEIKILEAKRMGVLSCAALLAQNTLDDDKRADMMRRLLRFWSGFKKNFAELLASDSYGDLMFALEATQRMKPRNGPLTMSMLPKRTYNRYNDYAKGTKGRGKWKHRDEPHQSFETVFQRAKEEDEEDRLPDLVDAQAIRRITDAIKELPNAERRAIEKQVSKGEKEKFTDAERKALSRARPKLKRLLQK